MKAAILHQLGQVPYCGYIEEPVVTESNQFLIDVTAVAVKNLDKLRASGSHYASYDKLPAVVGNDGVGVTENGTRVYGHGITGMMAEKAIITDNFTPIPKDLDDITAAALPNAVLGSAMPLIIRAQLKKGQNVLLNGATGVTGIVAVQIAKHYGANEIIVTGRNKKMLESLSQFGATKSVLLSDNYERFEEQITQIHHENVIHIVIDYLWGKPLEHIIKALANKHVDEFSPPTKIVTAGDMAGKEILLTSSVLRSCDIQIMGSGIGSLTKEEFIVFNKVILPEMFLLAAQNKLKIKTETYPLEQIDQVWNKEIPRGSRLVITI